MPLLKTKNMQPLFVHYNGALYKKAELLIPFDSRGLKYGEGFFTTMRAVNKKIFLAAFHLQRIRESLTAFGFETPYYFTDAYILQQVKEMLEKNAHISFARVRLMIYKGSAEQYDFPNIIIESSAIDATITQLNETGFRLGSYKEAVKSCDNFSHLKTNNYLCYSLAARFAKQNKLDDALVLNQYQRVADATIANIFIVKNNLIKTPALPEGCVNGVMRRFLIQHCRENNIAVEETSLTMDDVYNADEIFLTNAVYGIKWVQQIQHSTYETKFAKELYNSINF